VLQIPVNVHDNTMTMEARSSAALVLLRQRLGSQGPLGPDGLLRAWGCHRKTTGGVRALAHLCGGG
jgi:hypothetical protein